MTLSVSRHRRSHRGWVVVVVGVVAVALVAGAAVGLARLSGNGCTGPAVTLNVAASPDQFPVMSQLAEAWNEGEPDNGDRCAQVAVDAMPSSFAAAALSPGWEESRDGPRPDVWAPDSSVWLAVAAARPEAAGVLPAQPPPSLASSPVVLAMQRPMAEALGWPEQELGWSELLGAFARGQSWEQFGYPEWGSLRLGISDPTRTTAGLAGFLTVLDLDDDGTLSDEELLGGIAFSQLLTAFEDDTEALLRGYGSPEADANELPAAFPIIERDLAVHAADGPDIPLVPVYLREGVVFADYPYAVLRAPWVDEERQQVAAQFLAYLQGPAGREAYAEAGFRDAERSADGALLLTAGRGFTDQVPAPVRAPTAEGLGELLTMWPTLMRPTTALIVLDTSGSMDDLVPGTDLTRLELLQGAAIEGIAMLNNQTTVGLWEFSSGLTETTPHRELIPLGPAGEELGDVERRQAMVGAIQQLTASGGTGLYDTVHDSYQVMQEAWRPDSQNILVVITDGKDEFHDGRTLPQLLEELAEAVQPDRPLPIIAMAVGPEADAEALTEITDVTGGRTIIARDDVSAIQQVVLAFAGRIS